MPKFFVVAGDIEPHHYGAMVSRERRKHQHVHVIRVTESQLCLQDESRSLLRTSPQEIFTAAGGGDLAEVCSFIITTATYERSGFLYFALAKRSQNNDLIEFYYLLHPDGHVETM